MAAKLSPESLLPLSCLPPRQFETERLILRAIEPGDSKLMFDLYASDPVATKYMSFKCASRVEETAAFIEPAARYFLGEESAVRSVVWLITLKSSGQPMGSLGYGPKNCFTLDGGYILNRNFWNRGYGSEAWKCIVDWARTQPGVYRIEAKHDLENPASGKVMLKAGMEFEGILRRSCVYPNISDAPRDSAIYAWARRNTR